jgi:DsbC/DsbD-like thiol-disulfide interchange protein
MREILLILSALVALPAPVAAQSLDDLATVTVLPGWRNADGSHVAGLRIDLADGWKTYWRAPGDTGIPPTFSFAGSAIQGVTPHFPVPDIYDAYDLRTIGYAHSVVIPLTFALGAGAAQIDMTGQIDIGVCADVCIPVTLAFDAILPAIGAADDSILAALRDRPLTKSEAQIGTVSCVIAAISDGLQLTAKIAVDADSPQDLVIIETGDPLVWVSAPKIERRSDMLVATVDLVHISGVPFMLDRSGLRITLLGDDQAVDLRGCPAP